MATSPEAFHKVKEILRKLDRSIDSARERRVSGTEGQPSAASAGPMPGVRSEGVGPGGADTGPLRARPMRTPDRPTPNGSWTGTTGPTGR